MKYCFKYMIVILSTAIIFMVSIYGCTRSVSQNKQDKAKIPENSAGNPLTVNTQETASSEPGTVQLQSIERNPKETMPQPDTRQTAPISLGTLPDLIALGIGPNIMPMDPEIGPLSPRLTSRKDNREIYILANTFLKALSTGKILESSIIESERLDIFRSFAYTLNKGISIFEYRIGDFQYLEEFSGYLKVRLRNEAGSTTGELYFEKEPEGWMISDIQLDLSPFARP